MPLLRYRVEMHWVQFVAVVQRRQLDGQDWQVPLMSAYLPAGHCWIYSHVLLAVNT